MKASLRSHSPCSAHVWQLSCLSMRAVITTEKDQLAKRNRMGAEVGGVK